MSPVRVVLSGLGAIANISQTFGRVPSSVGKCCAFHVRRAVIELAVAAVASFNLSSSMTAPALPGKPWDDMAVTLQQEQEQQMHILHTLHFVCKLAMIAPALSLRAL